jgi:drug/metabolite transporter (DMT)-like permease
MIASACIFSVNAAVVKELGATGIDSLQTVFVRSLMGLLVPLPFLIASGMPVRTKQLGIQILQAAVGTAALMAHFYAWTKLPLATVTALIFTQALFTLLLAVLLIRAWVRWQRWVATAIGFFGVLIMVRPGYGSVEPAALLALFAGFAIALQVVLIARLPPGEKQLTMLFYLGVVGTLITAGPGLAVWRMPSQLQVLLLLSNGILGVAAQACIFRAFRVGDAAYVAPFDYSKLVVASLLGFFVFGEIPTAWTMTGAALVVLSTLYISRREQNLPQRRPART